MKKAIGYIRISTKDQSNYSLPAQEEYVRQHCLRMGWELMSVYKDDGQSAKSFDRASWNELAAFIEKNHKNIDYLVVPKLDRFSRDLAEALQMINLLEKEYNVSVVSVMENIGENGNKMQNFMMRTMPLMFAQMELMTIKDRTKQGQRRAAKEGYYVNRAPYGYKNAKDNNGKPSLVKNEVEALIVQRIFSLFLGGMQLTDIGREVAKLGYEQNGHSRIERILRNPTYCGLIKVPAYNDEPEEIVQGKHPAIVDSPSWYRVQSLLDKPIRVNMVVREEVPLRGELRCFCGKHFTAGPSTSKSGKSYWYYFCPEHRKVNLSANKIHGQFDELCREMSVPAEYIGALQQLLEQKLQDKTKHSKDEAVDIKKSVAEIKSKLAKLEEKFVLDLITTEAYQRMFNEWNAELLRYELLLSTITNPHEGLMKKHVDSMHLLGDIHTMYNKANVHQKQAIIRVVFDSKLYYENGTYRTPYLISPFLWNVRQLKEKRLLYIEQPLNSWGLSPSYHVRESNP